MGARSVRIVGAAMVVMGFVFIAKAGGNVTYLLVAAGLIGTGLGLIVYGDGS